MLFEMAVLYPLCVRVVRHARDEILVSFDAVVAVCQQVRSHPIGQRLGSSDVVCEGSSFGSFECRGTVANWHGRVEGGWGPWIINDGVRKIRKRRRFISATYCLPSTFYPFIPVPFTSSPTSCCHLAIVFVV